MLAGELAAGSGDHATAFAHYEQRLRGYIAGGQKQAAGGEAFLAPPTWKKIRQRNRFFKVLPYLPVSSLIDQRGHQDRDQHHPPGLHPCRVLSGKGGARG